MNVKLLTAALVLSTMTVCLSACGTRVDADKYCERTHTIITDDDQLIVIAANIKVMRPREEQIVAHNTTRARHC